MTRELLPIHELMEGRNLPYTHTEGDLPADRAHQIEVDNRTPCHALCTEGGRRVRKLEFYEDASARCDSSGHLEKRKTK